MKLPPGEPVVFTQPSVSVTAPVAPSLARSRGPLGSVLATYAKFSPPCSHGLRISLRGCRLTSAIPSIPGCTSTRQTSWVRVCNILNVPPNLLRPEEFEMLIRRKRSPPA